MYEIKNSSIALMPRFRYVPALYLFMSELLVTIVTGLPAENSVNWFAALEVVASGIRVGFYCETVEGVG